ncbi:hypothetical protein BN2476_990025 [Paraburkholderia piptadeniae]|uniref:Uncharacterized protein n=1 Tax=Paraburkholderia piptadeniae TaxID=1701573 RepID=A0A1N7SUG9_9BURK|nr:hypothetical protein BN2476_990025 [Paraburkholderia piptadeniae]
MRSFMRAVQSKKTACLEAVAAMTEPVQKALLEDISFSVIQKHQLSEKNWTIEPALG